MTVSILAGANHDAPSRARRPTRFTRSDAGAIRAGAALTEAITVSATRSREVADAGILR
jgi:hypothetical protein